MTIRHLHVLHSLDPGGGGPREAVKQLTAAAVRHHHLAEVVVAEPADPAWVREYDCPVHSPGPTRLNYGYTPQLAGWLAQHAGRFDAVIVNGLWQYHGLCTWRVLRRSPVPYYVFTHGMLDPWFKQEYPLKHLKKLIYWHLAERRVLRDAQAVLFTAEEERLLARQSFAGYQANEWVVNFGTPAPPGDPAVQRDAFLNSFPQLRGKRFLLFLGRIHPKKGCDLLIEAFAAARPLDPQLQLVVAGPDQVGMQAGLVRLAERRGIGSAVTWTGMIRDDVKLGALRVAEAFVLPSHQENFGIAVAEALACGTPVLLSNKVNIWREIIADGAGLAAADTLEGTTSLLERWIKLAPEQRNGMAQKARESFATRFNVETAALNLLAAIERQGGAKSGGNKTAMQAG